MAGRYLSKILVLIFFNNIHSLHVMPNNETVVDDKDHLKYKSVLKACNNSRDEICMSNNTDVCAMRHHRNNTQYKDFKNACYLFMSNMCDYPGEEFLITQNGTCEEYLLARRNENTEQKDEQNGGNDEVINNSSVIATTPDILRAKKKKAKTKEQRDRCPESCTDIYDPCCINANRYNARLFKLLVFVNQCKAKMYFCNHKAEFRDPNGQLELPMYSGLSWSYCGSARYLQFARFTEVTSTLGHNGWLAGDYRYSHILEPHQRMPGYG